MNTVKAEIAEFKGLKDLKGLLSSPGPCVSVYMPLTSGAPGQSAKTNALEWKETVRSLQTKMEQFGEQGRDLLDSVADWAAVSPEEEAPGKSIAAFRSPDSFCVTWLQEQVPSRAIVGPHFYIRPMLRELTGGKHFYLLALSQKNVRLLDCTLRSSEEVAFPSGIATSFDAFMNLAQPDHTDIDRSFAGPSAGHTKGVGGSMNTMREDKPEYLAHFFGQIDRGINELLRNSSTPLVIAAVDYELAQYRGLNTYSHLVDEDVQGAPNSLKAGEMHARAIEALERSYDKKLDSVLAEYNHKVGGGASNRLKDVVMAAHEGRVLTVVISDSLEQTGMFDEASYSVKGNDHGRSEDEDLVNDAAVQTVLHAGQVYVAPNGKMPHGSPVAAVFRY